MATQDPEFYEAPKFSPEYYEPIPRQRGCFFYGCVIASVLMVLLLIALALGAFFFYRLATQIRDEYTSTAPAELPKIEISEEELNSARQRIETFRAGLDSNSPVKPLVLNSDDLNALIEQNPDLKGTVYAKIVGDKLKAQVSLPLDRFEFGFLKGRYLNGEAELKASLMNGFLLVTLDSFEVNGKRPPEDFLKNLRHKNLAEDAFKNEKHAKLIGRFESLVIKDDKITIKVRPPDKNSPEESGDKAPAKPVSPDGIQAPKEAAPKQESTPLKPESTPPAAVSVENE
jgi:hypothetical protein